MSTNIDRSLDDIIKDQRKLKKRKNQNPRLQTGQKKGKQQQQQRQLQKKQGKGAIRQRRRIPQGKQGGQTVQQNRQAGQNFGRNNMKAVGNRGKPGGARIPANRLKNKQGNLQKSKQIISKAKQLQTNRRTNNRQNRQLQQNDARQNIINKKRGMQPGNKQQRGQNPRNLNKQQRMSNNQRRNRNGNVAPQLSLSINDSRVRLTRNQRRKQLSNQVEGNNTRRRWQGQTRGGAVGLTEPATQDLRISVANNLHQPPPPRRKPLEFNYIPIPQANLPLGTTSTTLNERFSNTPQRGVRTIVVD